MVTLSLWTFLLTLNLSILIWVRKPFEWMSSTTTQHVISELTGTNENLTVQDSPSSETSNKTHHVKEMLETKSAHPLTKSQQKCQRPAAHLETGEKIKRRIWETLLTRTRLTLRGKTPVTCGRSVTYLRSSLSLVKLQPGKALQSNACARNSYALTQNLSWQELGGKVCV